MLMGDLSINMIWWSWFIYRWCIESDAHKIDRLNNFEVPPVVPGKNSVMNHIKGNWTPLQPGTFQYTHYHKIPAKRPYHVEGFQIDDPINRQG